MARSANSIRSVLRKLSAKTSGPEFRSSCGGLRGPLVVQQQQWDEKWSVLWPSRNSDESPSAPTFCQRFPSPYAGNGGEPQSWGLDTSVTRSNNVFLIKTAELKLIEQTNQSWRANSSNFVPHPFIRMGSRGFSFGSGSRSVSDKAHTPSSVTPTSSSDGSAEGAAENAAKSVQDWTEAAYNGILDSLKAVGVAIDDATPSVKQFLEANPIIVEISLSAAIFTGAWVILPRVLRRMHLYVEMGSAALLQGPYEERIPYELSVWKALEEPARLIATLFILLQIGVIVAPNAAVAQYLTQFWSGGSVLCIVWFLHRWKSNVFKRLLAGRQVTKEERERYLGFDKMASLGLIFIGALGLAEAAGVAVSSLLTVGGIGGIATAFAAREILANLLTGLTLSFSKPFTVGDVIKAGTVEGKVEEVGMISTRLLNLEKKPIMVPNAFFTSQAIVNKSRAPWQYMAVTIPMRLTDFEKVPSITLEIREMLYRNPQVYLEEDRPRCHIAQFSPSVLELAISCNIKPMSKNEYLLVEQGIMVEAARIITNNGATLGGP
ncbi:unnamed protein product [Calypogeia fissa]